MIYNRKSLKVTERSRTIWIYSSKIWQVWDQIGIPLTIMETERHSQLSNLKLYITLNPELGAMAKGDRSAWATKDAFASWTKKSIEENPTLRMICISYT